MAVVPIPSDIPPDVTAAVRRWLDHLEATLDKGISASAVNEIMVPLARDSAWLPYGGSGRWSRFYLIDDCLQAQFDFNERDVLDSYSVYPHQEEWLKAPDGTLLRGFETAGAELRFFE
jgi:hypothetical protein